MLSIIESCLKSPLFRPGSRTLGLSLSFDSMLIGLVGWLDQRFPVSVKVMGAPVATWPWSVQGGSERPRAALPLIVCLRIAIGRACARPPPIGYGWALLWQCLRRSCSIREHAHVLFRCRACLPEAS